MNFRASLSVVTLHEVLKELCPFLNMEYWKYAVELFCAFYPICFDISSGNFVYEFLPRSDKLKLS